ncbi:MAG: TlyA family RNA methyltransferase [Oscillospiraceae bacterium]|nr:TlyA family RNA methyltransferase [Oscillospiraceae bacterium]
MSKIRLDQLVFDSGYAESRERAKAIVMSGAVYVNGQKADKPGMAVPADCELEVRGAPLKYVSRGGLKLEKALKVFPVNPEGKCCIDCGASTGGFTDVLLQNGASKVYSVDVGYGQLAWKLRQDERVVNLERCNLRYLTEEQIPEPLDLAVMDVSFISIRLILPVIRQFLKPGADYICLIKPQFEAGREQVGKKGVVRDPDVHRSVIQTCLDSAREDGYSVMGLDFSPIRGPEGNIEFLCHLVNEKRAEPEIKIAAVVEAAHRGKL